MEELLRLARELRPAALDDHGLGAALRTQVDELRPPRRRSRRALTVRAAALEDLDAEEQLVVYRVVQEGLSNVARHARRAACASSVERAVGRHASCARRRRRAASTPRAAAPAASGSPACASARCSPAGALTSTPRPGRGTTVELRLGAAA